MEEELEKEIIEEEELEDEIIPEEDADDVEEDDFDEE